MCLSANKNIKIQIELLLNNGIKGPASPRNASGLLCSLQQANQQLLEDHHHFSERLPSSEIQLHRCSS